MDESKVKEGDFFKAIGYLNYNPVGNIVAWDWVREHYDELINRYA